MTSGTTTSTNNSVGVGTNTPAAKVHVEGSSTYAVGGIFSAVYAKGTADYPMALMLDGAGTSDSIARLRALNNGQTKWQLNFGDDLIFYNWTNTFNERLALKGNGNVGIGTTAPATKLSIFDASAWPASNNGALYVEATNPVGAGLNLSANTAGGRNFLLLSTGAGSPLGAGGFGIYDVSAGSNASSYRFVINSAGNVGVGTASPGARFDVGAGVAARGSYSDLLIGGGGNNPQMELYGATRSSAITHDEAMGGMVFYTNGPTWSASVLVSNAGNVGIGTTAPAAKLHVAGDITVDGNINAKYQDVAEWVPSTQELAAGTVVILDPERPNHVLASNAPYDTAVAGVISARPGLTLGEAGEGKALVATTGRVKVKVDATRGTIKVGDLLVTSGTPGVAMKSQPLDLGGVPIHRPGTLIGKALEPLADGKGEILVLLSLQ